LKLTPYGCCWWEHFVLTGKLDPVQFLMNNLKNYESTVRADNIAERKKLNEMWLKVAKFFEDIGTYDPAEILYKYHI
jgi:hypothetical protein